MIFIFIQSFKSLPTELIPKIPCEKMKAKSCLHKRSPNNHDDNNEIYHHPQQVGEFRQDEYPNSKTKKQSFSKAKKDNKQKKKTDIYIWILFCVCLLIWRCPGLDRCHN